MEKELGGRGGRHRKCFCSLEFEGLKDPTKCNSIFVYWLFFDRLLKLHELKGKLRVPGHLLKGKMCLAMCYNHKRRK